MSSNVKVEEHDCYGNPFLLCFKDAVESKAKYALKVPSDAKQAMDKLSTGEYKNYLEEAEIEIFLYPTKKTFKKAEEIFQALTEMIAVMAFIPGGVTMFGFHYEVAANKLTIEKVFV